MAKWRKCIEMHGNEFFYFLAALNIWFMSFIFNIFSGTFIILPRHELPESYRESQSSNTFKATQCSRVSEKDLIYEMQLYTVILCTDLRHHSIDMKSC